MTVVDAQNMYNTYIYKSVQHIKQISLRSLTVVLGLCHKTLNQIYNIYNGHMNTKIDI